MEQFVAIAWKLAHWGRTKMATIFSDDILKGIFLNENVQLSIKISLNIK